MKHTKKEFPSNKDKLNPIDKTNIVTLNWKKTEYSKQTLLNKNLKETKDFGKAALAFNVFQMGDYKYLTQLIFLPI